MAETFPTQPENIDVEQIKTLQTSLQKNCRRIREVSSAVITRERRPNEKSVTWMVNGEKLVEAISILGELRQNVLQIGDLSHQHFEPIIAFHTPRLEVADWNLEDIARELYETIKPLSSRLDLVVYDMAKPSLRRLGTKVYVGNQEMLKKYSGLISNVEAVLEALQDRLKKSEGESF